MKYSTEPVTLADTGVSLHWNYWEDGRFKCVYPPVKASGGVE